MFNQWYSPLNYKYTDKEKDYVEKLIFAKNNLLF